MRAFTTAVVTAIFLLADAAAAQQCTPTRVAFNALRQRVLHPPVGHVVVVAHRACFAAAPENSPEAIDACWRSGVEVVENDVRSTKDGELVVVHDDTVDRTTDGWGYLNDLTMADVARLHIRDGDGRGGSSITPLPVTTLRAYYRAARNKVMINLELKPSAIADYAALLDKAVRIAREEGVADHLLVKVPDINSHGKVAARHILKTVNVPTDVSMWPIIWERAATDPTVRVTELERYNPAGYEVPFLSQPFFAGVARDPRVAGRPVMAVAVQPYWSGGLGDAVSMPDPAAGWGKLIDLGANVIMTDRPEYLLRFLTATGRRLPLAPSSCLSR